MATEKADGEEDGRTQNRARGVLESDCALVVPPSSTAGFHRDDLNVRVVPRNVDVSEMDAGDEISTTNDKLATNGSIIDTSDSFLHEEPTVRSSIYSFTYGHRSTAEEVYWPGSGLGATAVGTAELETGVGRLLMENEDELDENGDTALHRAIKTPTRYEEIDRLAAAAASVGELDAVNVRYQTALHLAVIVDRPDIVTLLVSRGASLRRQEQRHGDTVLHLACRLGRSKCLLAVYEALRWTRQTAENGDIKDVLSSTNYQGEPCLHLAARLDDKCVFYFLLFSFEVDVNVTEGKRGESVLHDAVNRRDMDVVSAVVDCKSLNVNQTTYDDLTALDMAINRRCSEAQRALVSAGAVCSRITEEYIPSDGNSDELTDMDCS